MDNRRRSPNLLDVELNLVFFVGGRLTRCCVAVGFLSGRLGNGLTGNGFTGNCLTGRPLRGTRRTGKSLEGIRLTGTVFKGNRLRGNLLRRVVLLLVDRLLEFLGLVLFFGRRGSIILLGLGSIIRGDPLDLPVALLGRIGTVRMVRVVRSTV